MKLTINEIVSLLETWNSWYLLQHDDYLKSEYSDNQVRITISPFEGDELEQAIVDDLRSYTDEVHLEEDFEIEFFFAAWEHQSDEIFKAIKPVLDLAQGSNIEIINRMKFTETDLPDEEEISGMLDTEIQRQIQKYREESGEGIVLKTGDEEKPPPEKIYNEIKIRGIIQHDHIEIEEILHNNEPFPDISTFLEASRLYETIKQNFEPPSGVAGTSPFACNDEQEAAMVSLFLGSSTDFRPRIVQGNTIMTGASPEELATVVSFVRYRDQLSLFRNPYQQHLRYKRKKQIKSTRKMLFRSCSCFIAVVISALILLIWWYVTRK